MAFNPSHLENLSSTSSLMRNANPGKGSGRRKKRAFALKAKRHDPPLFIPQTQLPKKYRSSTYARIANPYRVMAMNDNPSAPPTTSRNNDGMSYVW